MGQKEEEWRKRVGDGKVRGGWEGVESGTRVREKR